MSSWFYVDGAQTRQGPVTADALVESYRQGLLGLDSLVWREGMAEWAPLQSFRDELGLAAVVPMAPPAPVAEAPAKKNTGCLIAAAIVVGGGLFLLFVLSIVAAIALPAYQDYISRSKLAQIQAEGQAAKLAVDEFMLNTDRCPRDAEELGLAASTTPGVEGLAVGALEDGRCAVEITLGKLGASEAARGGHLLLTREEDGSWTCSGDGIPEKLLPSHCR